MMRILELGKFYPPHHGGIETLLRSWCEGFARRGAQVDCVVANDAPRTCHEVVRGVRLHRYASWGMLASTAICPAYLGSTRRYPADLWHAHFPNPLADLACLAGPRSTPLVVSYHSDVIRQARLMACYGPLLRRLLARAARIVVATPRHLDGSPWLGAYRAKCEVIPFGIDLTRYAENEATLPAAAELRRKTSGRPILLTIGRLVGYKGQRYLIEAARQLDAVVWLVGTGPLESELKALAAAWQLQERVRFWGAVEETWLPVLLQACDVFVLPSITPNEAFGMVQVEAMACGKAVVSCSLPSGVPYVNQHEVTGLVVPPADTVALAAALRRLLAEGSLRTRLGEAGRQRARAEFEVSVMIARYGRLFERLLGDKTLA
jgi:glycosyltransferase involved in cell wall biosynthesis